MGYFRDRREKYSSAGMPSNRRVDISHRGGSADFVDTRYHFAGRLVKFLIPFFKSMTLQYKISLVLLSQILLFYFMIHF